MKKIVLTKKKGILFCITGLPGSGKLSIAKLIKNKIIQNYGPTIIINGNYIRRIFDLKKNEPQESLGNGIKFSNLCKFLTDQKVNVIFAVVNLFDKIRKKNKHNIKNYVEIYLKTDITKIKTKRKKILYQKYKNNNKVEFSKKPNIKIINNLNKNARVMADEILIQIQKNIIIK